MRSLAALLIPLLAAAMLVLSGCSLAPAEEDETLGWSAEKLYTEAKDAMMEGGYERAVKYYEKLEARYPYGRFAQQAQLEIAYAYYRQQESASAVAACERFVRLHPNHPNVDYAYYLKGLVYFNEDANLFAGLVAAEPGERDPKSLRDAFDAFKELVTRFPDSKYSEDARQRMNYLVNAMAAHDVNVADYYMRRGAYVAAANRAQIAIKTYPETPSSEKALVILARAYEALDMKDLRDDTERILNKNFPNSTLLAEKPATYKPWWRPW